MEAVEDINQWREGKIRLNTVSRRIAAKAEILSYPAGKDDSRIPCQVRGTDPDIARGDPDWSFAMKRTPCVNSVTRELSDKELNRMASAMGDDVRSQSMQMKNIILENLKSELASRRKPSTI